MHDEILLDKPQKIVFVVNLFTLAMSVVSFFILIVEFPKWTAFWIFCTLCLASTFATGIFRMNKSRVRMYDSVLEYQFIVLKGKILRDDVRSYRNISGPKILLKNGGVISLPRVAGLDTAVRGWLST